MKDNRLNIRSRSIESIIVALLLLTFGCTTVEVLDEVIVSSPEEAQKLLETNHNHYAKTFDKPVKAVLPEKKVQPNPRKIDVELEKIAQKKQQSKIKTRTVGFLPKTVYQGVGNRDVYYTSSEKKYPTKNAGDPAKVACSCSSAKGSNLCAIRDAKNGFEVARFGALSCPADCSTAPKSAKRVCVSH